MKTKLKKAIYTLFIAIAISNYSFANSNNPIEPEKRITKISGKVIDKNTGEALAGVKIHFLSSNKFVYTDFDGKFTIESILTKKTKLSALLISYEKNSTEINNSEQIIFELVRKK